MYAGIALEEEETDMPDVARCSRCRRPAPAEQTDEFMADWIVKEVEGEVVLICVGCITDTDRQDSAEASDLPNLLTAEELSRRLKGDG